MWKIENGRKALKKINKSTASNKLTDYATEHPEASWEDFRDHNNGISYREIKSKIFQEQNNLCAYCETSLEGAYENNRRIEHFRSKSDSTEESINVHLDWFNLLGVCVGGSDEENKINFKLPANLSCDSHKAHLESIEKIKDKDWNGKVLFPFTLPDPHQLFHFEKFSGMLIPNKIYCEQIEIAENKFPTTEELVGQTIRVFNLNCYRLCQARLIVFHEFEKQVKIARERRDIDRLKRLVQQWKRDHFLPFQTTRDFLLSDNVITRTFL